jgi:hypothetical protein
LTVLSTFYDHKTIEFDFCTCTPELSNRNSIFYLIQLVPIDCLFFVTLHDIKLYPIHLTTGWNPTHNYAYLYIILKIWYYNHKTYEHEFVFVLRKTSSQSELTVSNKIYYFDWTILEYKYKNQTQLFYDRKTCLIQSNLPYNIIYKYA